MGSHGEHGVVCPVELYFVLWSGGQRNTSHSFHSAYHLSAVLWGEHSCVGSSHWKRLGALGFNGSPGQVVVLSCRRAAIFGFPVLILNQVPFESSGTGQIPSRVNCRVRNSDYLGALNLCRRVLVNSAIV